MVHRYTIKELNEWTDYEFLMRVVQDRQSTITNVYSPLNKRLENIKSKLLRKEELTK